MKQPNYSKSVQTMLYSVLEQGVFAPRQSDCSKLSLQVKLRTGVAAIGIEPMTQGL